MKRSHREVKLSEFVFFLGWALFLTSYTFLSASEVRYLLDVTLLYKIIKAIIATIFVLKIIFLDKNTYKRIIVYSFIVILLLINSLFIDNNTLFFTVLVILSAKNIDYKRFVQNDLRIRIALVVLIMSLSALGILPNFTRIINGSVKQAFGFVHPNVLCFYIITILLELLFLRKKINARLVIVNIVAILFMILFCYSRTAVLTYVVIVAIDIIVNKKTKYIANKIVRFIIVALPILLAIFSFYSVIKYGEGDNTMKYINKVSTTRISNGYKYYKEYGISLYGKKIETNSTRSALADGGDIRILDMGYLRIGIENGAIILVLFVLLLCLLLRGAINEKQFSLVLICLFYIVTGLTETNLYNIAINISLLSAVELLTRKKKRLPETMS